MDKNGSLFGSEHYTLQNGQTLPNDVVRDIEKAMFTLDVDGNGTISSSEFGPVLERLGDNIPGYKLREMIEEVDKDGDGVINFQEFLELYTKYTVKGVSWSTLVSPRQGVQTSGGSSHASSIDTKRTFSESEQQAFRDWINSQLKDDEHLKDILPIKTNEALFKNLKDGVILCKMINLSVKGTIDERAINVGRLNTFLISENNALVINSASAIGCTVVNIGAEDILQEKQHLILGLLWQIIRIGLFANITLQGNRHLAALLELGETIDDLMRLTPEELLLRWVNYHLKRSGSDTKIKNFSSDIKDSEAYAILLFQISPQEFDVDRSEQVLSILLKLLTN